MYPRYKKLLSPIKHLAKKGLETTAALEVSSSGIQHEVQKSFKKISAKGWYKVKGVLLYDVVTLGTAIFGGK